jgi:hypothetical protein
LETQISTNEANSKGGHRQSARSIGKKLRYQKIDLATMHTHMKNENPITYYSKDMANIKALIK